MRSRLNLALVSHVIYQNWQGAGYCISAVREPDRQPLVIDMQRGLEMLEHFACCLVHQKQPDITHVDFRFGNHVSNQLRDSTNGKAHQARAIHVQPTWPAFSMPGLNGLVAASRPAIVDYERIGSTAIGPELKT